MSRYQNCKVRDHQAHALRANFPLRHEHPRYPTMIRLTLRNILLDRSVAQCKDIT